MADEDDLRRAREGEIDLVQSDLRQADLSGWDLSGRDLTDAHLEDATAHGSNFSQATLNGAKLLRFDAMGADFTSAIATRTIFHGVNLKECNFSKSVFTKSRFTNTDLKGANFSGADFTQAHFNEGTSLEDAYADKTTRFDGATVFRPLAREPVFRFYRIERGKLVRLTEAEEPPEDASPQAPQPEPSAPEPPAMVTDVAEPQPVRASSLVVQQRIAQQPREIAVMAAALSLGIDEQIAELKASTPNEPRAHEAHEAYISFLKEISAGLAGISVALTAVENLTDATKKQETILRTARIAEDLGAKLETWISGHAHTGFSLGLLGVGTAFLSLCGVDTTLAFAATASSLSGGTFIDGIKGWFKSAGTKRKPSAKKKSE